MWVENLAVFKELYRLGAIYKASSLLLHYYCCCYYTGHFNTDVYSPQGEILSLYASSVAKQE